MKKLLLLLILFFSVESLSQTTINAYQASNEVIFNPDRGFSKFSETNPEPNYSQLSLSTLNSYKNSVDKISVIYRGFYLPYVETIPQTYLNKMQIDFDRLRQSGLKVIVRFAYTRSTSCTECQPTKSIILSHINQLSNVININKDVISMIQAGFIGAYGEYYYTNSTEFGDENYLNYTTNQWNNRKEVFDLMLSKFDISIPIQLRYPYAKIKMYGQSYIPRIGFFNDAFLNTYGDQGFFPIGQNASPSQQQINEVLTQTKYEPMVGETNGVSNRTNGINAINEMNLYNWSIINKDYFLDVINSWVSDGSYTTINKRLGYRYTLKQGTFKIENNLLSINLRCDNEGFTNVFKNRKVYILLNDTPFEINTNIKEWEQSFELNIVIDINDLPNGIYNTYLWLPDNQNQNISEYSIQFANLNTWENGKNNLNFQFTKNSLGINENENVINCFPNPTKDIIYLPLEVNYSVYSITGQLIMNSQGKEINLTKINTGVYIIIVEGFKAIKVIKI